MRLGMYSDSTNATIPTVCNRDNSDALCCLRAKKNYPAGMHPRGCRTATNQEVYRGIICACAFCAFGLAINKMILCSAHPVSTAKARFHHEVNFRSWNGRSSIQMPHDQCLSPEMCDIPLTSLQVLRKEIDT